MAASSKGGLAGSEQKILEKLAAEKHEAWQMVAKVTSLAKKGEKRLLAVGENRVYVLEPKRGKLAHSGHYLELVSVASSSPKELNMVFKGFTYGCQLDKADDAIHGIRVAYHKVFGRMPAALQPKFDVSPSSRLKDLPDVPDLACGGYAAAYKSVCDYFGVQMRPDIEWDINNVLGANNVTEFNIKEFEQPMRPEDQRALMAALAYNNHFVSFTCKNFKIARDSYSALAQGFAQNQSVERLELKNCGMSKDAFIPVCEAIGKNKECGLTAVVVPGNAVSDNTLTALGTAIGNLKRGLVVLDVSKNNTKTGVASMMSGIRKNIYMASTLVQLNVSHNSLSGGGSSALAQFLANPNGIRVLDLSHTGASLDTVIAAVGRGCGEIQNLNVAGNKMGKKESQSLTRFLQGAAKLKELDISETGIPPEGFKDVVEACSANYYLQDFRIICKSNKFGPGGAGLLGKVLIGSSNISYLDLGDNDFQDDGIISLCKQLQDNKTLKHLGLGGNFSAGGGKHREAATEAVIELLTSECPLESLDLSGTAKSQLKGDLSSFLYALGTDDSLKVLNIENNGMSDKGALALSKALQTNRTLSALRADNNGITQPGFQSLSYGLKRNFTLKDFPLPLNDITAATPRGDERAIFQKIIAEIDSLVKRNQSPQSKFSAAGSSAGPSATNMLITSGERELLERLRFKIKSTGRTLDEEELQIIEDAENNDSHIQTIHDIQQTHHMAASDAVEKVLKTFVPQLVPVVEQHQTAMLQEMMDFVSKRYRSIDDETVARLRRNIQFMGRSMDVEAVQDTIVDAAGGDIKSKVQECLLSGVTITIDYIYEKLGDMLQNVLDDVKTGAGDDEDDSDSEYEYEEIEVEVTDSDEEEEEEYEEEEEEEEEPHHEEPAPSVDLSTAPSLGDSGPPPPVVARPDSIGALPKGVPPGLTSSGGTNIPAAAPPPRPTRPSRPNRPGSGAGGPGSPVRGRGMPGRGRGMRGRGRGAGRGGVGGGIAARLEQMGGGIPMMGMMGGGPPGRPPVRPPSQNGPGGGVIPPPIAAKPATVASPARPASSSSSTTSSASSSSPTPAKKKGGGLFGRKKASSSSSSSGKKTKIVRRKVKKNRKGGAGNPRATITVAKPSGRSDVVERIESKESNIKNHMTRDRPMIQRKRRPPTRRPRNIAQ